MKKLRMLVRGLVSTGAILPGSIGRQFNVCGMPGCRCKDKNNPRKHGPYCQLSYGAKGKSSSMFVKEADSEMADRMTQSYRRFRDLTVDIGLEMVALCRAKGFDEAARIYNEILDREKMRSIGRKPEPQAQRRVVDGRGKDLKGRTEIEKKRVETRDLRASRDKWREESLLLRKKLAALESRFISVEKEKSRIEVEPEKKTTVRL